MIDVFCKRPSDGARCLSAALRSRGADSRHVRRYDRLRNADLTINWGTLVPNSSSWLNGNAPIGNKYVELRMMRLAGVPTPDHSLEPRGAGWLTRTFRHHAANDLLNNNLVVGDYYTEFVPTVREFRVHIIDGLSVRIGMKKHSPHTTIHHPFIRSSMGGWGIYYDSEAQARVTKEVRNVAKEAIIALSYDFGAVDVAITEDNRPIVWEVNSAPGLEGKTVDVYADKFIALAQKTGDST